MQSCVLVHKELRKSKVNEVHLLTVQVSLLHIVQYYLIGLFTVFGGAIPVYGRTKTTSIPIMASMWKTIGSVNCVSVCLKLSSFITTVFNRFACCTRTCQCSFARGEALLNYWA